jgi:hypothetical protein
MISIGKIIFYAITAIAEHILVGVNQYLTIKKGGKSNAECDD